MQLCLKGTTVHHQPGAPPWPQGRAAQACGMNGGASFGAPEVSRSCGCHAQPSCSKVLEALGWRTSASALAVDPPNPADCENQAFPRPTLLPNPRCKICTSAPLWTDRSDGPPCSLVGVWACGEEAAFSRASDTRRGPLSLGRSVGCEGRKKSPK